MPYQQLITDCIERYRAVPGGLLPLLHAVQEIAGCIPAKTIPEIASAMNLSGAEVQGVISFYHDFRSEPGGSHTVQICRAEACQAVGGRDLETHAKAAVGVDFGETTADGQITLEAVYCLGNCACSPSVRIDDRVYARVDGEKLDTLLAALPPQEERL